MLKFILLCWVSVISVPCFATSTPNMKATVEQFANEQYEKISKDTTIDIQQQLYQYSMPLLATAAVKDNRDYLSIRKSMEIVFNDESKLSQLEKPWQLWILGRMALAAKLAGDKTALAETTTNLATQLFKYDNKDVVTGWAFSYLAAIDTDTYKKCQKKLFEYTDLEHDSFQISPESEASNFIWTLVMNLYAAANAGDKDDYHYFLQTLKELTPKKSLKETSLLVPTSDYRQWLVSLERNAFALMNDHESLTELDSINQSTVDSFDSMLAWANEILTSELLAGKNNSHE